MPAKKENRKKNITIGFRVSPREKLLIDWRIALAGMSHTKYYMNTYYQNIQKVRIGRFESERLAVEFKRLTAAINSIDNNEELNEKLEECIALLSVVKEFMEYPEQEFKPSKPLSELNDLEYDEVFR